ncbi:TetR/AcrR family transcriptional regulator C-terminal domain-containing protein [Anaerocolumna sp. AGMB13020]|uniref:TetR/AcrR family transcriptional regulator n=1 Tax=Anaerocolumna sp. AGMB13020 TaxID=3081750 RepID=UPI0029545C9B|nr:TetR/AcrR family transcriptional regulator C-terminal domain-containing protein [Anaerocolumna sp. AGMB13020]WOO35882.1 TetR/AcrR family transcriptional regulator C-terminal domain-containing protein [Anaerocolumna sp. AGMB13020]
MSQITKRALEDSLKKLLLQKPLNKITISDIANDCGINRMTFYYHFKDIYDLIEWICIEETARAINGKKTYETWQQGFLQTFQMVLENKPFISNVYHSISREKIEDYFYAITYDLLIGVIEEKAAGMKVSEADKKFIANFYNFAFVGLLMDWIKKDMKENPQLIIDQLSTLIHGEVSRALEKYQNKKTNQIPKND